MHATCSTYPTDYGSGAVGLRDMQLVEVYDQTQIAGCLVNGLDEYIADGPRPHVSVSYGGTPADPGRPPRRTWGGMSHLTLPEALAPGHASVFVSQFDVPDDMARIEVRLTKWTASGEMNVSVDELSDTVVIER